jgi:hypothetical protein
MSFFALVVGKPLATTEERAEHMNQQVTWRMAFTSDSFSISRMASLVGTMSNSNVAAFRLKFHFLHNWQTAVRSGADHKPVAFPGYLFLR